MNIIAVVGTGSGCGKTTVVCRILRAIPGLGAVKISPREGESLVEWGPGAPGKDTELFAGSGADPVARIVGPRAGVPPSWELIKDRFARCRGVVFEGACALDLDEERCVVFVVGTSGMADREERNREIAGKADVILERSSPFDEAALLRAVRAFLAAPEVKGDRAGS